jgi:hypothetical protein
MNELTFKLDSRLPEYILLWNQTKTFLIIYIFTISKYTQQKSDIKIEE